MNVKDFEIMAPVGSRESLAAAIKAGADSVYFGIGQLNMRSHSANHFTIDDLREIAETCNAKGIKTYLTVNTIIYDGDIPTMHQIIDAAHDHPAYTFLDNKVCAWWCLPIMGTGLQRDIHRGLAEQRLVLGAHRGKGVHLRMALATAHVVALADDSPLGIHDNRPHHGVGLGCLSSVGSQLQAAAHIFFVFTHKKLCILNNNL